MKMVIIALCLIVSSSSLAQTLLKTEIKNSSTTIEKGKVARVVPMYGDVKLNGVFVGNVTTVNLSAVPIGQTYTYTINRDASFCISAWTYSMPAGTTVVNVSRGGVPIFNQMGAGTFTIPQICTTSETIVISRGANASASTITINSIPSGFDFWAKSGDVITGSQYLIELYER